MSRGWKSGFAELFVFALDGPTALTGVERRSLASSVQGRVEAEGVGLGLGLIRGLGVKSVAAVSLSEKSN